MFATILQQYNLSTSCTVTPITNGLINHTYKITTPQNKDYILQKININVFKNPFAIDHNITNLSNYLQKHHNNYLFTHPLQTITGATMLQQQNEYWRLFAFVPNSHSKGVLSNAKQAFEAAAQFGKLTKLLTGFDIITLETTIPNFHNLQLRYTQFEQCLQNGNVKRMEECKEAIDFLLNQKNIIETYNYLISTSDFILRVTHHDTKISNVLFDDKDKAICVIDLDTIMPGYYISDVGDMMRTYLCAASEEETDFTKIKIRKDYYNAIKDGYLSEMNDTLNTFEKQYFNYAGEFIIYMQALRFLTDYINNDIYYGAQYEHHNLNRAKNQIVLLQQYQEMILSNN